MHRFFYRKFQDSPEQNFMAALLTCFGLGAGLGSLGCLTAPSPGMAFICRGVILAPAVLGSQILCALLPLLLAAGLCFVFRGHRVLLTVPFLAGLLFSFSVTAFAAALQTAGWIFSVLLLAGRGMCLPILFWFLLRRFQLGVVKLLQDLVIACCISVVLILVFHWLLSPVTAELRQSIFIIS